jgi:hypothetical protein
MKTGQGGACQTANKTPANRQGRGYTCSNITPKNTSQYTARHYHLLWMINNYSFAKWLNNKVKSPNTKLR